VRPGFFGVDHVLLRRTPRSIPKGPMYIRETDIIDRLPISVEEREHLLANTALLKL
jgi:hypothetical protein